MDMIQGIVGLKNAENMLKIQMAVASKVMQVNRDQGQATLSLLQSAIEGFEESVEQVSMGMVNQLDTFA